MTQPLPPTVKQFRADEIDPAITKLRRRLDDVVGLQTKRARHSDPVVEVVESNIRNTILEVFGPESPEYRQHAALRLRGTFYNRVDDHKRQASFENLVATAKSIIDGLVARLGEKRADMTADTVASVRTAFQQLDLHPRIADVAGHLYRDGHYRNAVLDAALALTNMVKEKSCVHDRDGVPLMRHVFSPANPVLRLNDLTDQSDRDFQDGLMQLFAGAVAALRNPRAHNIEPDAPEYALECIAFLSFLAKHVERADRVARPPPP